MKIHLLILFIFFCGCKSKPQPINNTKPICTDTNKTKPHTVQIKPVFNYFEREIILANLHQKIKTNQALIVHAFVPLCDNEHQGIIPTSASLGDGLSTKTNLYWATSNGMKKHFLKLPKWELVKAEQNVDTNILERVLFKKVYNDSVTVYLIADAYRGDRMANCLENYFQSLADKRKDRIILAKDTIKIAQEADLLLFNGHNGLMDLDLNLPYTQKSRPKDAVIIACSSQYYFLEYLNYCNAYPLVTTTNLLYPGAFISAAIIDNWANFKNNEKIRLSAGDAYYKAKPKASKKGARNLFKTGW